MSHYSTVKTIFKNLDCLLKALEDVGFTTEKIEVHEDATNLYGFQGDKRSQKANVIIRKRYVGGSSNDIGFVKQEDGSYEAIISDFDKHRYGQKWMNKLSQRYAYQTIKKEAIIRGYSLSEVEVDGKIKITCAVDY